MKKFAILLLGFVIGDTASTLYHRTQQDKYVEKLNERNSAKLSESWRNGFEAAQQSPQAMIKKLESYGFEVWYDSKTTKV